MRFSESCNLRNVSIDNSLNPKSNIIPKEVNLLKRNV